MNDFEKITQEKLQEILLSTYNKVEETKNINIIEVVESIKEEILSIIDK
ncbi:hypothetical protein J2S74_003993 [Evansella vedderi]|uniref:Uncharacterized protein n=1 Tax=Evansella vedderi TaxID=38282 RepID=A0ABU0A0Q5_9BACI|nr:hypothetical protein [Evansella vedderi]MDQ0256571.1 hypothetical protein [Evansella vedderi]